MVEIKARYVVYKFYVRNNLNMIVTHSKKQIEVKVMGKKEKKIKIHSTKIRDRGRHLT